MKMFLPIFLFLIFSKVILANQEQVNSYEAKLTRAIDLVFNFKFNEAEQLLLDLSEQNKSDARPFLYLSNIYVWKFIGDRDKKDFDKFELYSKKTIERAENQINKNSNDLWSYFALSSVNGYRALMYFMNRDYLDGLWAVRKSINWTNDLVAKKQDFYDGYLWRGVFYFSLHQVPSAFKGLLSIVGFKGDIKQGLKDLQLVSRRGTLAKVEADYFLSQFYSSSLNDNQKAYELLRDLVAKYPDNELFMYSTAVELIKLHKIDEAKFLLNKIIKNKNVEIDAIRKLSFFLNGDCSFYQNDFKEAIGNYEQFVNNYNQNQYKPTAYFRSALANYYLNDKSKAKSLLEKAISIDSKVGEDKFHQRYAKKILSSNFDERIMKIFYGWNFLRAGKFENAINTFDEILNSNSNNDFKIVASYLKGLSFYKLNDSSNARKILRETIKLETKDELWAKAFAYLYLARIEFNSKNYQAAENYLIKIDELENYDFENSIKSQAKNLKDRIEFKF
ncbi:MAG: DUF3808 domain-containing protein [Ignavibacteria bacterium]|nr:DUF3808 domain-containing protein [Ignavibacteria bacterium]